MVRRIKMVWFYPIVAGVIVIGVILFAAMYSAGGAKMLEQAEPENTEQTAIPTGEPQTTGFFN